MLGFATLSEQSVDFLQKHNILDTLAIKKRLHEGMSRDNKLDCQIEKLNIAGVNCGKKRVPPKKVKSSPALISSVNSTTEGKIFLPNKFESIQKKKKASV